MSGLARLARRFGFEPSVPLSLVEGWSRPMATRPALGLAPRDGAASLSIDEFGRLQPAGASWSMDLSLAAGARWVPAASTERVKQRLIAPGVIETTLRTPSGPVVQRVAAGVVDGQPVAIIEVENTGGVAIAVAMVIRPLRLAAPGADPTAHDRGGTGRGYLGQVSVDSNGMVAEGRRVVRFATPPATVKAFAGSNGDLLDALGGLDDVRTSAASSCRSGGAQLAAVWPLVHTQMLRVIVELAEPTAVEAPVPSTDDINRGWRAHLSQGMRVEVDGLDVATSLHVAIRTLLTAWPRPADAPLAIQALAESGFGRDAGRFFELLDRCDDDAAVLRAMARWAHLVPAQPGDLEAALVRVARAARVVDSAGGLRGPAWLGPALSDLADRLVALDQPDVAERVAGLVRPSSTSADGAYERYAELVAGCDERGMWPGDQVRAAASLVVELRALLLEDSPGQLAVLSSVPPPWRGRTIDVFGLPVPGGAMAYGLRWHGPRPALLWEVVGAAAVRVLAPGIDAEFASTETAGESLLADPGWPVSTPRP